MEREQWREQCAGIVPTGDLQTEGKQALPGMDAATMATP